MNDDIAISREAIMPYWNAAVYGVCLYVLGVGFLKALVITVLVLVCVALHYGARWTLRGGIVLLALTVAVWIGAVPPPDQWHDLTAQAASWSAQAFAAAR